MAEDKPMGQGKGRFTKAGVQAQQATDIEMLKAAVAELATAGEDLDARVDALESAGGEG